MSWGASIICRLAGHNPKKRARWNHGLYFTRCRRCGCDLVREVDGEWHVPRGYKVVWRDAPLLLTQQAVAEEAQPASVAEVQSQPLDAIAEVAAIAEEILPQPEPVAAEAVDPAPDAVVDGEPQGEAAGAEVVSLEWPFVRERRARPSEAAAILPMPELDRRRVRQMRSWQIVDEQKASEEADHEPAPATVQIEELRVAAAAVKPPQEPGGQSIMADQAETSVVAGAEPVPETELEAVSAPQPKSWRKRGGRKKAASLPGDLPGPSSSKDVRQVSDAAAATEELPEPVDPVKATDNLVAEAGEPDIVAETEQAGQSVVELAQELVAGPLVPPAPPVRTKADDEWDEFMADDSDAKAWEDLLRDPEPPEPVFTPDDFMDEELPAPRSGSVRF